jgi:hypothetical protein
MKRIKRQKPRTEKLTPRAVDAIRRQHEAFKKKFGREPGPDDPVFFDPNADTPQPYPEEKLTEETATALRMAGVEEAKIYAYRKTGMIITKSNYSKWSKADLQEFRLAMEEYRGSLQ